MKRSEGFSQSTFLIRAEIFITLVMQVFLYPLPQKIQIGVSQELRNMMSWSVFLGLSGPLLLAFTYLQAFPTLPQITESDVPF